MIPKDEKAKGSLDYTLRVSIAGGLAGCAAKTVVAPLDRVKILFQTNRPEMARYSGSFLGIFKAARSIQQEFGMRGLLQGHSATLLRIYPYASIKFTANEQFKHILMPTKKSESWSRHFIAGSLAGTLAVFFSYPLEMFRVRMAFEMSKSHPISYSRIFSQIYSEQSLMRLPIFPGISNFYRGFVPTIIGMIPYAGLSFATYDFAKRSLTTNRLLGPYMLQEGKGGKQRLRDGAELFCGGLAGGVGQTFSYPLEIIRRHMQVAGVRETDGTIPQRRSIAATMRTIYAQRGVRGFYVGLTIGYIKVVPMSAVSFWVYEGMKRVLFP